MNDLPIRVLAFYKFTDIVAPHEEIAAHIEFFKERDVVSRIYISEEGINGQMSASSEDASAYIEWMRSKPHFHDVDFKVHHWHEHVFPRKTVKYRKQLVAIDRPVDLSIRGEHLSPKEWKDKIEGDQKPLMLDVRNEYEWKLGHFEGAELPPCDSFREFDQYAEDLKSKHDPATTPVMMYCTGGIRCELYSSLLMEKGFQKVYQLNGGIINYGLQEGSSHWLGKLFVFDDRLAIPISSEESAPAIGTCAICNTTSEDYYNCANMDCNHLFLCCLTCLKEHAGCCGVECRESPRLRPYQHQLPHKPFRRWHHYFEEKQKG